MRKSRSPSPQSHSPERLEWLASDESTVAMKQRKHASLERRRELEGRQGVSK